MKVKYNKKTNTLNFGNSNHINFKPDLKNKDKDFTSFDVLSGLQMRISSEERQSHNVWNIYALNAISCAMMFLHMKRLYAIAEERKHEKNNKHKKYSKVSKKTKSNNR